MNLTQVVNILISEHANLRLLSLALTSSCAESLVHHNAICYSRCDEGGPVGEGRPATVVVEGEVG